MRRRFGPSGGASDAATALPAVTAVTTLVRGHEVRAVVDVGHSACEIEEIHELDDASRSG